MDITSTLKSGTHMQSGKQFLNEHRQSPQLYRMTSQPSKAHLDALGMVESLA